jgi:6-phosphogluconolactonase (cycloisomerase 2 family)
MAMKVRALVTSVLLLTAICLVSCGHYTCGTTFGSSSCTSSGGGLNQGGGNNGITQTAFEYFMDDGAGEMSLEGLNVAGSQAFLPISNFASPFKLGPVTNGGLVVVNKQFLYFPLTSNGTLYGFSINAATGALTTVSASSPYTIGSPTSVAADPNGKVLFVGGSAGISTYTVSAVDGSLTFVAAFSTGGISPTQLVTDGLGKYVFGLTGGTITAFSYTSAGVLSVVPGSPFAFAPSMAQIEGEKSGKYLVGITAEDGLKGGLIDKNIYVFGISSTGVLTALAVTPTVYSPVYVAVSPNGAFVYTFNVNGSVGIAQPDPMEGFSLDSTGTLTKLSGSPFVALDASIGRFDQSGQYLFVQAVDAGVGGSFVYGADTGNGSLTSTIPHLGFPSTSFAVTDAP